MAARNGSTPTGAGTPSATPDTKKMHIPMVATTQDKAILAALWSLSRDLRRDQTVPLEEVVLCLGESLAEELSEDVLLLKELGLIRTYGTNGTTALQLTQAGALFGAQLELPS